MRPCQIRSYTMDRALNRRARRGRRENEREKKTTDFSACSVSSAVKRFSGGSEVAWHLLRALLHSLGPAPAHEEQANPLQQICGRIHSGRQEDVGLRFVI